MTDEQFLWFQEAITKLYNMQIWLLSAVFLLAGMICVLAFFVGKGGE